MKPFQGANSAATKLLMIESEHFFVQNDTKINLPKGDKYPNLLIMKDLVLMAFLLAQH